MISSSIGIVVIGRNEGERLVRCLSSIERDAYRTVYVDSDSTDGSVAAAERLGAFVVKLDSEQPLTAARARNEGFAALAKLQPELRYVQFVDGDCELSSRWLDAAISILSHKDGVAIVCGRRREKYPAASVYNRMVDIEWDTPVGQAAACGGDSLVRISAFRDVGGFEPMLMAGEELEFCARLSQRGWKILRVDEEMSLHDANMLSLSQWWFRSVRAGCALMQLSTLRTNPIRARFAGELLRSVFWAFLLPLAIIVGVLSFGWSALVGLLFYLVQVIRIQRRVRPRGKMSWLYSSFIVLDNFPRFHGILRSLRWFAIRKEQALVEYKQ